MPATRNIPGMEQGRARSPADRLIGYTSRPWEYTKKSHNYRVVLDSKWEATEAFDLERNNDVTAWVKNNHIGFVIYYTYQGTPHTYYPDYHVRLTIGLYSALVIELTRNHLENKRRTKERSDSLVSGAQRGFNPTVQPCF